MSDEIQKSNRKTLSDYPLPASEPFSSNKELSSVDTSIPSKRKSLWPFYYDVERYEYSNPEKARALFDQILAEGLDNYTASPDLWHNTAMVAGRVQHRIAQLAMVEAGLREWPDNVDLLCDELQYRHTSHYDIEKAQAIWERLDNMPREKTGPYWRFWVYGAIYHAVELDNPQKGLELLDEGLKRVKRDSLMDILRSYRRVLVDSIPLEKIQDQEQLIAYHKRALRILEDRYKLGIELGVENGYVLATELAQLYQEQAGISIKNASEPDRRGTQPSDIAGQDYLRKALEYLDLAERLYTGSPNHPVWEIYEARARILMAQRKYGDALKMLRSLPQQRQAEPSIATMLRLAILMTGEKVETEQTTSAESFSEVLSALLQNDGELLFRIASDNPRVALVLKKVVQRL